ncbi:MAG TPA: DUF4230 domain-containing protein [Bacteroidota bacterium]
MRSGLKKILFVGLIIALLVAAGSAAFYYLIVRPPLDLARATESNWSQTWLGSTKTIVLRGVYTAKAGFDLRESFSISIENNPLRVTALMPPAQLLSVELKDYHVVRDESGWWNKVSVADRENAVRQMQREARQQAETSGMIEESQRTVEERIREIVEKHGTSVEIKTLQSR